MTTTAPGDTAVELPGPEGVLEGLVTQPKEVGAATTSVTVVCHPHSLMGGTMHNKVVHTVARARRDLGHRVVRFNFRGVGSSAGSYAEGIGEQEDLLAVLAWVQSQYRPKQIWLAGFSFGAFVAAASCQRALDEGYPIQDLLLLAPAVVNYSFAAMTQFPCRLTLIYGTADEVVDHQAIEAWYNRVESSKQCYRLAEASHFFHGRLAELKRILLEGNPV